MDFIYDNMGKLLIGSIILSIIFNVWFSWVASCKQADIFNKFSDVKVSCSDVWWAGDSITSQNQTLKLR